MLIILSPAKTFHRLASERLQPYAPLTFHEQTSYLISILKSYEGAYLSKWMKMSKELGEINEQRYKNFESNEATAGMAMDYLNGEAYKGLEAQTLGCEARSYLGEHLLILSGLYGCIRPQDAIKPYRLEMATKFQHPEIESLYTYWKEHLTDYVLKRLEEDTDEKVLIDLASTEYAKVLDMKKIRQHYPVVTISFKEEMEDGKYKVVGMYAKKSRGMMARYMAEEGIGSLEQLKAYAEDGYLYREDLSDSKQFVFTRKGRR